MVFVAGDEIGAFRRKSGFWRSRICQCEPHSFPITKGFSDANGGEISKRDF